MLCNSFLYTNNIQKYYSISRCVISIIIVIAPTPYLSLNLWTRGLTKWRVKPAQMMSKLSEEELLAMGVKNLLPIYHKYLFAQYFPNFKALIASRTQTEDAIKMAL